MTSLLHNKFLVALGAGLTAGLLLSLLFLAGFWQTAQFRLEDVIVTPKPADPFIVIVAIDDDSLAELGRWPWDRSITAELISKIASRAKKVGVDIAFVEPSDDDTALQDAIADNVVLGSLYQNFAIADGVIGKDPLVPVVAAQHGFVNIYSDKDGITRALYDIKGALTSFTEQITGVPIPDERTMIGWTEQHQHVSAQEVLAEGFDLSVFDDAIVLIGGTAVGLFDIKQTPFGKMAGVEVQANFVESAVHDYWVTRESTGAVVLTILALALAVSLALYFLGFGWSILVIIALFIGYIFTSVYYYEQGLMLNILFPLLAIPLSYTLTASAEAITERMKHAHVRELFGKYISQEVAAELIKDPEKAAAGEEREITIMFTDIRGFTSMAEKMTPKQVVKMLNTYLGTMSDAIIANKGVIDKYIGDAIMAFWNAPLKQENHAALAVKAAQEMQARVHALNKKAKKTVHVGIGIATGHAVVGSTGTEHRLEYTALGDTVNLASRLCSHAGKDEIVIAKETQKKAQAKIKKKEKIKVKGKQKPVEVYLIS